jgi:hypothetical protein
MPSLKLKGRTGLALLFFWGVLVGASITLLITEHRLQELIEDGKLKRKSWLMKTLEKRLTLTSSQHIQIEEFYEQVEIERRLARIQSRPALNDPAYKFVRRIRSILSEAQNEQLTEVLQDNIKANRVKLLSTLLETLNLTLEQRKRFDRILARHAANPYVLRSTMDETVETLLRVAQEDLEPLLTSPQRDAFEGFLEEYFGTAGNTDDT